MTIKDLDIEGALIDIHRELQDFANLEVPDSLLYDDEQELSVEDVAQARSLIRLFQGAIKRAAEAIDSLTDPDTDESEPEKK